MSRACPRRTPVQMGEMRSKERGDAQTWDQPLMSAFARRPGQQTAYHTSVSANRNAMPITERGPLLACP